VEPKPKAIEVWLGVAKLRLSRECECERRISKQEKRWNPDAAAAAKKMSNKES